MIICLLTLSTSHKKENGAYCSPRIRFHPPSHPFSLVRRHTAVLQKHLLILLSLRPSSLSCTHLKTLQPFIPVPPTASNTNDGPKPHLTFTLLYERAGWKSSNHMMCIDRVSENVLDPVNLDAKVGGCRTESRFYSCSKSKRQIICYETFYFLSKEHFLLLLGNNFHYSHEKKSAA